MTAPIARGIQILLTNSTVYLTKEGIYYPRDYLSRHMS